MSPLPRLLTIMGSGETAPTMVSVHKDLLARVGPPPVPAVMLDTPFGFQANRDELVARAQEYFRTSVQQDLAVAPFASAEEAADTVAYERLLAGLRQARYVFAGPGSPTYALRQWAGTLVPKVLAEKLATGGAITFASAAALTLGVATVPVYEIYKVGAEPHWLPGLDLLAEAGLRAAVIPHYNNAEGGTHDTRFCYLGEDRLRHMEAELPEDAFVLGVDEHTGLVLDLGAGSARVVGNGVVTVRRDGTSTELPTGTTVTIEELRALAEGHPSPATPTVPADVAGTPPAPATDRPAGSPLLAAVRAQQQAFDAALAARDADAAVGAILALDAELVAWSADTLQSDEVDQGRSTLRSMVVRLGEVARTGARDPRELVGPFVDVLLDLRRAARADKRYADADAVRDRLIALGVEVRDTPAGSQWELQG